MPAPTIRPFEAGDYQAVVSIWNRTIRNRHLTVEQMKHDDDAVAPPRRSGRLVATIDGAVVGAAQYEHSMGSFHPDKYYVHVYVDPDHQRRGVGGALYSALRAELDELEPLSLRVDTTEDDDDSIRFAENRGFVTDKKDWQLILDLSTFRPEDHRPRLERVEADGITIESLTALGDGDASSRLFHELFSEVRLDVPRTEPPSPISYQDFLDNVIEAPDFLAAGTFLAFDGDDAVGLTMSWTAGDPPELHTGLTAVRVEQRGRGIATALKIVALTWAKADGRAKAVTDNDINNVEMLAVNEKLGYAREPAILNMVNHLR